SPVTLLRDKNHSVFKQTITDRFEVIAPHIKSGDVLDLGCVDSRPAKHSAQERIDHKPNLLLKRIFELNKNTLGIDIDHTGTHVLKKMGFNAQCANVET